MIQQGVNETTIILLLMIPLIATLVSISRHIIGIKSFGVFTPVILSVAFASISDNLETNLIYGLSITLLTIVSSIFLQYIIDVNKFKIFRMHYIPKLGLIITSVSLIFFIAFLIGALFGSSFVIIEPLPFFLIITLVEDFITKSFNKGIRSAIGVTLETLTLSLVGYLLIIFKPLQQLLLRHPEIVLLALPVNFLIGKYVGLRVKEFYRFSDITDD